MEKLLQQSSNINAKHQLVRLLNFLSNDCDGRAYILGQHASSRKLSARSRVRGPDAIVRSLANALIEEGSVDSAYKQTLLGTLQKLSLRRSAQSLMIRLNLIPHLHELLEDVHGNKLSEYTIEHGVALLVNLCLRSAGKRACVDLLGGDESGGGRRTLGLLMQLLQYDNEQVKTHVTSALYNLFSDAGMREEGREMGVAGVLNEVKGDLDERFERQVKYVLEILDREFVGLIAR